MLKQCTILFSLLILSAVASAHSSTAHKRKKPTTTHNFNGTGIATFVGGTEGKYFKTAHFANSQTKAQVYKPKPTPKVVTKELPLPMLVKAKGKAIISTWAVNHSLIITVLLRAI